MMVAVRRIARKHADLGIDGFAWVNCCKQQRMDDLYMVEAGSYKPVDRFYAGIFFKLDRLQHGVITDFRGRLGTGGISKW